MGQFEIGCFFRFDLLGVFRVVSWFLLKNSKDWNHEFTLIDTKKSQLNHYPLGGNGSVWN